MLKKIFFIFNMVLGISLNIFAQEIGFPIPTGNSKQLFYLQRTPNKNTIVYELNYNNGNIDKEDPIHGFWIRYQEKGQKEELSYIQKTFAYGLKTKKIAENQFEICFVSYKKFKMYLRMGSDKLFHLYANINQKTAELSSIYLKINGGAFWTPNIEYVDIYGIDPVSRSVVKERMKI
jgi:phosphoribosyl-ATP pyrophosphohydrolase